ncbi:cupin domain-containing protein [Pedobacter sp. UYP30]|uniref:cupin domain-containing protein n=1 Tax=Pedobacter sp. UYP30 TaxID=1756400 RepID=UPI003396DEA0
MDLKEFLDSGLLELNVIGALAQDEAQLVHKMLVSHPEIKKEIAALEVFFEQHAIKNAVSPHLRMGKKMERLFSNLAAEQNMQLSQTPLISGFSDSNAWLELISPLLPKDNSCERFKKLLRYENGVMQLLIVSSTDIDEEVHEDLDESFLILKGTCVCTIGNTSINMGAGDFMQIPLDLPHTVTITSNSVTAILQRVDCAN